MINAVENSIRLITLGRKNYLFSGNDSGAEDNSIFYTLLGSCLQAGVEPAWKRLHALERISLVGFAGYSCDHNA